MVRPAKARVVKTVDIDLRKGATPLIGQLVGERYRLERQLGVGGMGAVYLATHEEIGKQVAVKILRPELVDTQDMFKRFRQEAKAATKIGHANIVDISDFGVMPGGAPYFVMEYLEGRDLGTVLKAEGPLPWQRVFRIGQQICSALHAAHQSGIIHRDVKPENFFVVDRGDDADFVKVLDFGIAKLMGDDQSIVTRTGVFVGTPEYMSPEQAEGLELDARVDVYGVGIMLYQLLAGRVPFRGRDEFEILNKHVTEQPPPPSEQREDVKIPARVEAVVLKALEKDREHRYQDMEKFGGALARAIQADAARGSDAAAVEAHASAVAARPVKSTPVVPIAIAAVVALIGLVTALVVLL